MRRHYEKIIVILFLLNSIAMWVFWTGYIQDFSENNQSFAEQLAPFMVTHIVSEYTIGIMTFLAFMLLLKKSKLFSSVWFFALGMHFYAAVQALGWAFANRLTVVFINLIVNIILIGLYFFVSFRSGHSVECSTWGKCNPHAS